MFHILIAGFTFFGATLFAAEEIQFSPESYIKIVKGENKLLDFSHHKIVQNPNEKGDLGLKDVNEILRNCCYKVTFIPKEGADGQILKAEGKEFAKISAWNVYQKLSSNTGLSTPEKARLYKENYRIEKNDIRIIFLSFKECELGDEEFLNLSYYISDLPFLQSIDLRENRLTTISVPELLRIGRQPNIKSIFLARNKSESFEFVDSLAKEALKIEGPGSSIEILLKKLILIDNEEDMKEASIRSQHWSESWEIAHKKCFSLLHSKV